jgi:hypothetical protein
VTLVRLLLLPPGVRARLADSSLPPLCWNSFHPNNLPTPADDQLNTPPADANILINTCRLTAQRYYYAYQEPMPVEQLVRALCDTKQVRDHPSLPPTPPAHGIRGPLVQCVVQEAM